MPLSAHLLASLQHPLLAREWHVVSAVALSVCNRPDCIPQLFHACKAVKDQCGMAAKMREALLKASVLAGLPKTINSLTALRSVTPSDCLPSPQRTAVDYEERGRAYFDRVYGKICGRVAQQLEHASPDLYSLTMHAIYGQVLSYSDILSPRETSFVVLAALIPQDVNPQLKGHLQGALNNGATVDEVNAVRQITLRIVEECSIHLREPTAKV